MKKLTKAQIIGIKIMIQKGKKVSEVAKELGLNPNTILYHTNPEFRDKLREYNRKRYRNLNPEQKKEYFEKKREYQRDYHKRKYQNDSEFRDKQRDRAKKYQQRNYNKK